MKVSTARFFLIAVLLITASLYGVFIARTAVNVRGQTSFTLVDDAMISMRYARNLASGAGLVWNAGDPPVEGFTNFLWVGLMAVFHLLPLSPSAIALAVMVCSGASLTANLFMVWKIAREVSPETWPGPALAILLTGLYFPLVFWSLRGLELGFLFFLLNASTLCVLRLQRDSSVANVVLLGLCLSLALLTRPDTAVQASVLLGASLLFLRRDGRYVAGIMLVVGVAAVGAGIAVFRYCYFGDIAPNTYYLKVTGVGVTERLGAAWTMFVEKSVPKTLVLLVVTGGVAFVPDARLRKAVALFLALFLAQAAYNMYVGGDFAEGLVGGEGRFLAQAFGPLIIAYSLVAPHLFGIRPWEKGAAAPLRLEGCYVFLLVGLGSAALLSGTEWERWRAENAPLLRSDIERMNLGLVIEQGTRSDAVVAVHAAGNIPYYCRRRVIDLLGKSDRVIARGPARGRFIPGHNKWDYDYSIGRLSPDIIADGWEPLWEYLRDHPGRYSLLPPHGIFVLSQSPRIIPGALSRDD